MIGYGCDPMLIYAIKARFFTNPIAALLGISAGYNIPHSVLCNVTYRVCYAGMDEFTCVKYDNVDINTG